MVESVSSLRISLGLAFVLTVLRFSGCAPLAMLDARALDYRVLYRGPQPASERIVIVAIDEASIEAEGRWPWPRSLLARLLRSVDATDPLVIGLDLVNSEPSRRVDVDLHGTPPASIDEESWRAFRNTLHKLPSEDSVLAESIRESGRVVLGYFFDLMRKAPQPAKTGIEEYNLVQGTPNGRGEHDVRTASVVVGNLPELTAAARATGYLNTPPDLSDGHLRRIPLALRYNERLAVPLAMAMAKVAFPDRSLLMRFQDFGVESVYLGDQPIAVDEEARMTLNPRGPARTFEHISAADVLHGRVPHEKLAGKFVLVGMTASALVDVRPMAFDGLFPGVEVHATALDNILSGDSLRQPRWIVLIESASIVLLVVLLGAILERIRGVRGGFVAISCVLAYLGCSQWLFESFGIPLAVVYPIAAIVLTYSMISIHHFLAEQRARHLTREAFGRYLSPELARIASDNPTALKLGGDKRTLTVMFSDIRGFTSISEKLPPEDLVEMLNTYLTMMTDVVFAHGGMVDKYVGDAIMAVWGAPLVQPDHASRACRAAMSMVKAMEDFARIARDRNWPCFEIGIGLHTGEMIVGNMGSMQHLSYTVIGDNVNLGSRLEGLSKTYGVRVIASEETVLAAEGAVAARELDRVAVKGRRQAVRIFELTPLPPAPSFDSPFLAEFDAARNAYARGEWSLALAHFEAGLKHQPADGPSTLFVSRCREFTQSPPPADWQGVTVMETK